MSAPAVDIVILSWGRIDETCAAIDSALAQEGVTPRVIVIDQGSKPDEIAQLEVHCAGRETVTLIKNSTNAGVPGGRHQGAELGSAPYLVFLDNDAEFATPGELARAVAEFERDGKLGALAFRIRLFAAEGDDASSWTYPHPVGTFAARRFVADRFVGAGHMIRRSAYDAAGGYDPRFVFMHEEMDLAYRIINAGYSIVYEPSVAIRHKVSADRRVTWSGDRYYYHLRNRIYIAAKYNFSFFSSALDIAVVAARGLRAGYVKPVLRGLAGGAATIPAGLAFRASPGAALTEDTKRYIRAAVGAADLSFPQRVQRRLKLAFARSGR